MVNSSIDYVEKSFKSNVGDKLGSVLTEDGKYDTEIRKRLRIIKDTFQKLSRERKT